MTLETITLREAVGRYVNSLPEGHRIPHQTELNRFLRWFEGERLGNLTAADIERFQEHVEKTGADTGRRLDPVKVFLAWAHKNSHTEINFGKFIRIKRSAKRSNAVPVLTESEQLTPEGFAKLREELDTLVNVKRSEIAEQLYEARIDKDFRENAPYDAAKQHQAEVEARIRQLERILATATVIEPRTTGNRVHLGAVVILYDLVHEERLTYTLVSPQEASPRLGKISLSSPVGKALIDRKVGDEIEVDAPAGKGRYRIEGVNA
jgi:transcription elongation factor GreA